MNERCSFDDMAVSCDVNVALMLTVDSIVCADILLFTTTGKPIDMGDSDGSSDDSDDDMETVVRVLADDGEVFLLYEG